MKLHFCLKYRDDIMAIGNEDKRVTINDRGRKQEECTGNLVFVSIFS